MPRKDPTDNWFNNGANRLWERHPLVLIALMLLMIGLMVYLRLR